MIKPKVKAWSWHSGRQPLGQECTSQITLTATFNDFEGLYWNCWNCHFNYAFFVEHSSLAPFFSCSLRPSLLLSFCASNNNLAFLYYILKVLQVLFLPTPHVSAAMVLTSLSGIQDPAFSFSYHSDLYPCSLGAPSFSSFPPPSIPLTITSTLSSRNSVATEYKVFTLLATQVLTESEMQAGRATWLTGKATDNSWKCFWTYREKK